MNATPLRVSIEHPFQMPNNFRRGKVVRAYDGDTPIIAIDLATVGLEANGAITVCDRARLAGLNAPEMPTDEGKKAKDHLESLCEQLGCFIECVVEWVSRDNYGRLLVVLWSKDGKVNLNKQMIADGFAVPMK